MSVVVADTSEWIEYLAGRSSPHLERALATDEVFVPAVVVAELVTGARKDASRAQLVSMLNELGMTGTDFNHWVEVGELRRKLLAKGLTVSTPDAHVAACALSLDALLLTRDQIFLKIARYTALRVV